MEAWQNNFNNGRSSSLVYKNKINNNSGENLENKIKMGLLSWFKKSKKNTAALGLAAALSAGSMAPDNAIANSDCTPYSTGIAVIDSACDTQLQIAYDNIVKKNYGIALNFLTYRVHSKVRNDPAYYLVVSQLPKRILTNRTDMINLKIHPGDLEKLEKQGNYAIAYFARGIIQDFVNGKIGEMRRKMLKSSLYSLNIDFNKDEKFLQELGFEIPVASQEGKIEYMTENFYRTLNNGNKFESFFNDFAKSKIKNMNFDEAKLFNESIGLYAIYSSNSDLVGSVSKLSPKILQNKLKSKTHTLSHMFDFYVNRR